MGTRRYLAGALSAFGGGLMLASGYSSRGFLYTALGYAEPSISRILSGSAASAATLAIAAVEAVIALGGLSVLLGGLFIIADHITTGRLMIYFGGGAGFLGLLVSFGYSAYRLGGIDPVLSYLPYWIGLAMAVTGRHLAKGAQ